MKQAFNELVAMHVMAWERDDSEIGEFWRIPGVTGFLSRDRTPDFGGNIAAAWQAVEKISEEWIFYLNHSLMSDWTCELIHRSPWELPDSTNDKAIASNVESASLAICLAALRAVGVDEVEIQAVMQS